MQDDAAAGDGLELMPRSVRHKLDRVGLKVHLRDWQALSPAERVRLRDFACDSEAAAQAYAALVNELVARATGHAPEPLRRAGTR